MSAGPKPFKCRMGLHAYEYRPPVERKYHANGWPIIQKYRRVCLRCGVAA